jgi:excisionase family DNA binding protein
MKSPSIKEAHFIQGSGVFRAQRRLFVSTQTEAPPVVRTHLRPTEIAARTGLSKSAVFSALYTGQLRATRVGRAWLISTAAIDEWLDDSGRHAA